MRRQGGGAAEDLRRLNDVQTAEGVCKNNRRLVHYGNGDQNSLCLSKAKLCAEAEKFVVCGQAYTGEGFKKRFPAPLQ